MRTEIWQKMLKASNNMVKPVVISGAIPADEIDDYMQLYKEIFTEFIQQGNTHQGCRVYVGDKQDNHYGEKLKSAPPASEQTLQQWTTDVFEHNRFGIVLNSLEKYSLKFAEKVAKGSESLLELTGMPMGGLAFLCFVGNYDYTPFGVHKEILGEEGFLFHMGPHDKTFYTWETSKFYALSKGQDVFPVTEEVLGAADHVFKLKPGDVLCIPSEKFHVGQTPEFSISMVMDFINPSVKKFSRQMAQQIAEKEAGSITMERHIDRIIKPSKLQAANPVTELCEQIDLCTELNEVIQERYHKLRSNHGYHTPTIQRGEMSLLSSEKLALTQPYKLQFEMDQTGDTFCFYARGHKITVINHPKLPAWLLQANQGTEFNQQSIAEYFLPEWELQQVMVLLSQLAMYGVIAEAEVFGKGE
ncbi:MAG: hypothetical protein ACI935_001368 [Moritella dasanensis]|jgi:hypothetical protein